MLADNPDLVTQKNITGIDKIKKLVCLGRTFRNCCSTSTIKSAFDGENVHKISMQASWDHNLSQPSAKTTVTTCFKLIHIVSRGLEVCNASRAAAMIRS